MGWKRSDIPFVGRDQEEWAGDDACEMLSTTTPQQFNNNNLKKGSTQNFGFGSGLI